MDKPNTTTMTLLTDLTETEMQELAEAFATFWDVLEQRDPDIHADLIGDDYADAMMKDLGL
jgi:hypothetical protein